jgi:hypothetical protein
MENFTRKQHLSLHLGLLPAVLFLACIQGVPKKAPRQITAEQSPKKFQYPNLGLIATDLKASEVWKEFSRDGRYRIASKEESKTPEKYGPYGDGDFNGDHDYHDFAAIVIDTLLTDASRFGVVIFNARNRGQGYDGPFLLQHEYDLSRASLGTSSHGPLLVGEYRDDGSLRGCVVKWNPKQSEYRCVKAR